MLPSTKKIKRVSPAERVIERGNGHFNKVKFQCVGTTSIRKTLLQFGIDEWKSKEGRNIGCRASI